MTDSSRALTEPEGTDVDAFSPRIVKAAYDVAASDYTRSFGDDLERLPLDRAMLDAASTLSGGGPALDLGCGPGPVASHLRGLGASVVGVDLSDSMLDIAKSRSNLRPVLADMRDLPFGRGTFSLVVAYYSIHHLRRAELGATLDEIALVLRPQGAFLLATHLGEGEVYASEFLGHEVTTFAGSMYSQAELVGRLEAAGFAIRNQAERGPLEHEYPSQRIYLVGQI
jgi:SAM-dependent methyltransferase